MYLSHASLLQDFESDHISAKDVFYFLDRLPKLERQKFIKKARFLLVVRNREES
jgi:hypothetical protein